jgi:hypothetical protein
MAKQIINIGTGPNTGTADSLRVAFEKVNANFTEIYNGGIGGSDIDLSAVDQHIIPATDSTYDLGSSAKQWRSLYVSTNTIYIDNTPITVSNNTLVVGDVNNQVTLATLADVQNIPKGDTGATGPAGPTGATGSQGPQGIQGIQGIQGATGAQGSTGPAGPTGSQGPVGPSGAQGDTGPQGPAGPTGPSGADGVDGAPGATGPAGATGPQGLTGPAGAQGAPGAKGDTGNTGAQGVSVTLQGTKALIADLPAAPVNPNDFAGHGWIVTEGGGDLWFWNLSETAWNNVGPIVGPQGDQGAQGPAGSQGAQGPAGADGAPGADGADGATGATGATGPAGATGATGPQGEIGPTGPAGPTGAQGPAGADGVDANPDAVVNGLLNITLDASGDFIPGTDILQDLGSPTNRFRHVYVGPGSVYIGNNVITESATGTLVLPGFTRATGYYADEVEDKDRWGSNPVITGTVTVIDASRYRILAGRPASANYSPATYTVQKDGNRIDEINVTNGGSGWDKVEADYARDNNMYATNVAGAINNFNAGNWQQIPFRVEVKAEDTEYEDIFGGGTTLPSQSGQSGKFLTTDGEDLSWADAPSGASTGDWAFNGNIAYNGTSYDQGLYVAPGEEGVSYIFVPGNSQSSNSALQLANSSATGQVNITAHNKQWEFDNRGVLRLPADGDIINSSGQSVLGGGSNSYTPDDTDNWEDPAVNTIQAALDELAARMTAFENFEIDGGNAYTPAFGELIIDGNGA